MTRLKALQAFIDALQDVSTSDELGDLMDGSVRAMGFDHFAIVHHADLRLVSEKSNNLTSDQFVFLSNFPKDWTERYLARGGLSIDPVLAATQTTSAAFTWDRIPQLIRMSATQRKYLEALHQWGIVNGVSVPANVPGELYGSCHFVVKEGRKLPSECLAVMQPIGVFAFEAARRLSFHERSIYHFEPVRLTDRQLECLTLVAHGKTDWEISRILGISEETVKQHLRDARNRYDVPKRVQAIVRALLDGQLPLTELLT